MAELSGVAEMKIQRLQNFHTDRSVCMTTPTSRGRHADLSSTVEFICFVELRG
jgi:hypothetical protein